MPAKRCFNAADGRCEGDIGGASKGFAPLGANLVTDRTRARRIDADDPFQRFPNLAGTVRRQRKARAVRTAALRLVGRMADLVFERKEADRSAFGKPALE